MLIKILYVLFVVICCWITYLYTLNKAIEIANLHDKTDEMIIDYLGKAFEHIAVMKTDINKISEIIYDKYNKNIKEQEKNKNAV